MVSRAAPANGRRENSSLRFSCGSSQSLLLLPCHFPLRVSTSLFSRFLDPSRTDHDAFTQTLFNIVGKYIVQNCELRQLAGGINPLAGVFQDLGQRGIRSAFAKAKGESHVPRPPVNEGYSWNSGRGLSVQQAMPVFDLDPKHDLSLGIQWPYVSFLQVVLLVDTPNPGRKSLAPKTSQPFFETFAYRLPLKRIANCLHKGSHGFGRPSPTQVKTMDPCSEDLFRDPASGFHCVGIQTQNRQGANNRGCAVSTRSGTAINQSLHELTKRCH